MRRFSTPSPATGPSASDAEITLEANPTSVEAENFAGYRSAGVNRLSLGVQALDDRSLKALGRQHTAEEALAALALAKRHFDRVSFDLIYAREGQTAIAWEAELSRALDHAADHLSLYQLTIEEGTPFAALHAAGSLRIPDGEQASELYGLTQELCEAAGLPAYEVSNHARPGSESRHNLLYWRGHDYAGVGPGAHSRITTDGTKRALSAIKSPEAWLARSRGSGPWLGQRGELERRRLRRRISADGPAGSAKASISPGSPPSMAALSTRRASARWRAKACWRGGTHGLPRRPKAGSC